MNIKKIIEQEDSKEYRFVIIKNNDHQYFDLKKEYKDEEIQKAQKEIKSDIKKINEAPIDKFGDTLNEILEKYAPPSASYIGFFNRVHMEKFIINEIDTLSKDKMKILKENFTAPSRELYFNDFSETPTQNQKTQSKRKNKL